MTQIFGTIAKPLGWLLIFLYETISKIGGNYGITIILFTVIVRLCLFPLYASQIKTQMKTADLQPKLQALQKKYANDKQEFQKKQMELYSQEKVNPMKGCLPMLIQMPIILSLFYVLRNPATYDSITGISNVLLFASHSSFLWIPDLSQPDLWILPIAAGITTFISSSMTGQTPGMDGNAQQMAGMMKMMKYFFPVMIVWMGRSFPAGLTVYWFIGNICTIVQFYILKIMKQRINARKWKRPSTTKKSRTK